MLAACCRRQQGKGVGGKRHPSFLGDAEGSRVEDQSLWGAIAYEHFALSVLDPYIWLRACGRQRNGGEKLFVVSTDVASAFDALRPELLGDAILSRGSSVFSAAAVVRENLNLFCRPSLGHVSCEPAALEVGARQGGPRTPSAWNQLVAPLIDELLLLWSRVVRPCRGLPNGMIFRYRCWPTTSS